MRVLVLATDAFGGHGGIAKFNRDFVRALCAYSACKEVVAIPRYTPNPIETLPAGLTYVASGTNGKLSYITTVLKAVCHNPKYDLIVCGHVNLLPIAFLLRLSVRAPVALVIHGIDAWRPSGRPLTNYLAKRVDALISVSELTRQRFVDWTQLGCSKSFLLPNAIDLERFGPGPKNPGLLNRYGLAGQRVMMSLGRLESSERYKGFDELLELLPILIKEMPDLCYLVVGDGSDRARLEQKAKSLGVGERVVFTGLIPETEKADHYRLADAYVMPSRGEGFGIVYLEAMACGIPVVAGKLDGGREAVRDGALGILVDPRDQESIKEGALEALNRPKGLSPEGLDFFSYSNFERRSHRIVDSILAGYEKGATVVWKR